jgi:DNA invertase Pin-like site-specific DNA recombinase
MAPKIETKNQNKPKIIAYLRVSTLDQDTAKDKADILNFANNKDFGKIEFVEEKISGKINWKERKIFGIIESLCPGDKLIVPELSRLGRSMLEIMEILSIAKNKEIGIYDIRNGWELNQSIQSKVLAMAFSIAAEIERDLISKRTKEGLRAAKAQGRIGGRPKGPGKSKLDEHREEIIALLGNGSTKSFIAKRYHTTDANFWNWLKKNNVHVEARP